MPVPRPNFEEGIERGGGGPEKEESNPDLSGRIPPGLLQELFEHSQPDGLGPQFVGLIKDLFSPAQLWGRCERLRWDSFTKAAYLTLLERLGSDYKKHFSLSWVESVEEDHSRCLLVWYGRLKVALKGDHR